MRRPLPAVASIRDFYAFEQHVATCRRQRGLDMVPEWYQVPVFYFSNPAGVVGHEADVWAPADSQALDYELELACVIGREARDLPDDDRALEAVAGFTIMNDWSARDLQRIEMAVGLGPSKGKDFATSLGPELVSVDELADRYHDGRFHLEMTATVNGRLLSRGNSGSMYWTWPQLLAHASRDTTLAAGRRARLGNGRLRVHSRADARGRRRLAQARRRGRAGDRAAGNLAQPRRPPSLKRDERPIREENIMPPYLRLGSIPRKRHTVHPQQPGFKGEGIYYEEVVGLAGFSRGLQHRLSLAAADARGPPGAGGDDPGRFRRPARPAPSSRQNTNDSARGRPDLGSGRALRQRRRHAGALPPRAAAAGAVPQRRCR